MIIELRKVGFNNKGAELMLRSIVEQLRKRYPDAKLVMAPSVSNADQPFTKLVKMGFFPKAWLWRYGIQWGDFARFLPAKLRDMYGLVLDRDIDVVIDAAGFSYSDEWGSSTSLELARSSKRWKSFGTKVILLPQAFGPFKDSRNKDNVKKFISNVDLVFAREKDSYQHLVEIVGDQEKVRISPDFTNLCAGVIPPNFKPIDNGVALVPNYRMVDKTSAKDGKSYVSFMTKCASYLKGKGLNPFILIHDYKADSDIAQKISRETGDIPIIMESDPIYIKGILGTCHYTVGSRYHGLVSALSQGVPSIATGWSHKYKRLFEDYQCHEYIIPVSIEQEELEKVVEHMLDEAAHGGLREKLLKNSLALKEESEKMWNDVFEILDKVK